MNFGRAPRYAPAEPLELATGRGSDFLGFGRPITAGTANAGRHDTGAATTTFCSFCQAIVMRIVCSRHPNRSARRREGLIEAQPIGARPRVWLALILAFGMAGGCGADSLGKECLDAGQAVELRRLGDRDSGKDGGTAAQVPPCASSCVLFPLCRGEGLYSGGARFLGCRYSRDECYL
jgi:hypothetical protein